MQNVTVYYQAELDYRHEQLRRDWNPLRTRRARAAARAGAYLPGRAEIDLAS